MKKILYLLMLTALFVSCSSDDNNTDQDNGNKGMIDEKILGKWKVEYSKTIKGVRFLDDGTIEIADNAVITEYNGNYTGYINQTPKSGLFDVAEFKIEIENNNSIIVSSAGKNKITISYKVEDGYLKWIKAGDRPYTIFIKYRLDNKKLTMEMVKATGITLVEYRISEYSRITE